MGPPSSFFLAIVAIVILAFAIFSFISAVNYKNVSNNATEGESIDKGTANSLSTTMIVFGLIMIIVFIWIVYVIFTYDNKEKSGIDPRDASLLAKARESIYKLDTVKTSYKTLQDNFNKFKDKSAEKNKVYEKWDYCPSPRIKVNIKQETGEVLRPEYDETGNIVGLIIKPKKDGCEYKKIDLEMETQPCYVLKENDEEANKPGFWGGKWGNFKGMTQTLGPLKQSINPMYPSMQNVVNSSFQLTNPATKTGDKDCNTKGFLSRKTVEMPALSFKKSCADAAEEKKTNWFGFPSLANTNAGKSMVPSLNPLG